MTMLVVRVICSFHAVRNRTEYLKQGCTRSPKFLTEANEGNEDLKRFLLRYLRLLLLNLLRSNLFHRGKVHVPRVIEYPPAVRAAHEFLLRLAADENLRRQPHVASATHAVLHADHHVVALAFHQAIV